MSSCQCFLSHTQLEEYKQQCEQLEVRAIAAEAEVSLRASTVKNVTNSNLIISMLSKLVARLRSNHASAVCDITISRSLMVTFVRNCLSCYLHLPVLASPRGITPYIHKVQPLIATKFLIGLYSEVPPLRYSVGTISATYWCLASDGGMLIAV